MYNTRGVILVKGNSGAMYMDIAVKIIISVIVCSLVSLTILGILDNVYIKIQPSHSKKSKLCKR